MTRARPARIAALGHGRRGWHRRDLERAADAEGCALRWHRWQDLGVRVIPDGTRIAAGGQSLSEADAVLTRTMPAATLERAVFRMDALARLEAQGVPVINPARAVETAADKYLALARLAEADLPVPPTAACQTAAEGLEAFDRLGGDVVLKSLFGAEGLGMTRVADRGFAERAFTLLERQGAVIYLQRFRPDVASDLRVLVLEGRAFAAMRRAGAVWPRNAARGGAAEAIELAEAEPRLAERAAEACGAIVAGVDLLRLESGATEVLEVNAVPGWRELQAATGTDVARAVIRAVVARADATPSGP